MTHSSRNTAKVDHAGDDLVLRQARDEQADRDEAAAEQQQPEVGGRRSASIPDGRRRTAGRCGSA